MKKNLMFLAVAAIGLAGCKGGFKKAEGGLEYNIVEHKSGPIITDGDFVALQGIIKTEGDSVLANTYEMGHPLVLQSMPKPTYKGDLITALNMLSEGDSVVIKVNIDTMSKKSGQPRPVAIKGKSIVYALRIEKVIAKGKLTDQVFQGRVMAYFKAISDKAKAEEPGKIKKYIADKKLTVVTTASGLNYVITQQGKGIKPAVGDTAVVNYTGKFVNDKVFDTNVEEAAKKGKTFQPGRPYKPVNIAVGVKAVIAGWDEGLSLLNEGSKATFVIPSNLAYGEQGAGQIISPFTPIVFDVELIKVIHPNPNAPKPVMPPMPQMQQQQQPTTKK